MARGGIYPITVHPILPTVTDSSACCQCGETIDPVVDLVIDTAEADRFLHRERCLADFLCTEEGRAMSATREFALVVPALLDHVVQRRREQWRETRASA